MRSLGAVKLEIVGKMNPRRRDRLVVVKINLHVLDRAPKPFDENVVIHPPASIHAYFDPRIFQKTREIHARELRPLVRVENLRLRDPECFPQRLQTESGVQCRGKLPENDIPALPVQNRYEINKSMGETDIRLSGRWSPCFLAEIGLPSPLSEPEVHLSLCIRLSRSHNKDRCFHPTPTIPHNGEIPHKVLLLSAILPDFTSRMIEAGFATGDKLPSA